MMLPSDPPPHPPSPPSPGVHAGQAVTALRPPRARPAHRGASGGVGQGGGARQPCPPAALAPAAGPRLQVRHPPAGPNPTLARSLACCCTSKPPVPLVPRVPTPCWSTTCPGVRLLTSRGLCERALTLAPHLLRNVAHSHLEHQAPRVCAYVPAGRWCWPPSTPWASRKPAQWRSRWGSGLWFRWGSAASRQTVDACHAVQCIWAALAKNQAPPMQCYDLHNGHLLT